MSTRRYRLCGRMRYLDKEKKLSENVSVPEENKVRNYMRVCTYSVVRVYCVSSHFLYVLQ